MRRYYKYTFTVYQYAFTFYTRRLGKGWDAMYPHRRGKRPNVVYTIWAAPTDKDIPHVYLGGNSMTYEAYCRYMARYGFVNPPLTIEQFEHCLANKVDWYGASCDVNAGVSFGVACMINPYPIETGRLTNEQV